MQSATVRRRGACPPSAPPSTSSTSSPSSARASILRSAPPPRGCSRCPRTCSIPGRGSRTRELGDVYPVIGILLVDGMLTRDLHFAGRTTTELLGAGDILRPWDDDVPFDALPVATSRHVHTPPRAAILDTRVAIAAGRWPSIAMALHARHVRRARSLAFQRAIAQLPRVDDRMLVLLGRWPSAGDG